MAGLSSATSFLAPITNGVTQALSLGNLILVTAKKTTGYQPQNKPDANGQVTNQDQPPTILFHYEGEQTASFRSDITDHFIEDNTAIQDQIALPPIRITTHGFIGELNDVTPSNLIPLKVLAEGLTIVDAYTPVISETAILAYNEAQFLYAIGENTKNLAVAAWSSITGNGGENVIDGNTINGLETSFNPQTGELESQASQTKQQIIFQQFFGYWVNRYLFTVQTPWAIFENMAIESLRAIQSAETEMISDFELTFKQLRFASTVITTVDPGVFEGRSAVLASPTVDNGTVPIGPTFSLSSLYNSNYNGLPPFTGGS